MIETIATVLGTALQWLYGLTRSYLVAIVLLTVGIKVLLHPLTRKQLMSMKAMAALAPQLEVLRRKYKDDARQLNTEVMSLYRANKVNPFSGCLPLILQLPVLWALFALLRRPSIFGGETLFGVALERHPDFQILAQHPLLVIIPLLSGLTTYWQQKMSITDPQQARMFIFMPFLVAWFSTQFPLGMSIYWIASTMAYVAEYYLVVGPPRPVKVAPPRQQRAPGKSKRSAPTQEER